MVRKRGTIRSSNSPGMFGIFAVQLVSTLHLQEERGEANIVRYDYNFATQLVVYGQMWARWDTGGNFYHKI